jgi:secretion/DNA translocation related TadE-like protein
MTGRDRGSVSVLAAGVAGILVAIVLLSVDAALLLAAQARTETAADAAALAAAQEQVVASEDPAGAASRFAAANDAELVACRCEPGGSESVVAVRSFGPDLFLLSDRRELWATARAVVDLPAG